jgi:hypothetical protein
LKSSFDIKNWCPTLVHYVALSRVRSLNGLHILDLNKDKITVADSVIGEMKRLRIDAPLKLCYTPLYTINDSFLKVVFHNTRSLHAHFEDIQADHNIKNADLNEYGVFWLYNWSRDSQRHHSVCPLEICEYSLQQQVVMGIVFSHMFCS